MKVNVTNFLDFKIYNDNINEVLNPSKTIINTINPHSFCKTLDDKVFKKALIRSNILLADGYGVILASKLLYNKRINRITGADIHDFFIKYANEKSLKIFYLGSTEKTLNKIKTKLNHKFSNIKVHYYSPPFKNHFSNEDNKKMIFEINKVKPDILFIGMTAPKQEKWVYANYNNINVNYICSIGAVFDFFSGNIRRAPKWIRKIGLEWIFRSLFNFRLAKRNLISNPRFILHLLQIKL